MRRCRSVWLGSSVSVRVKRLSTQYRVPVGPLSSAAPMQHPGYRPVPMRTWGYCAGNGSRCSGNTSAITYAVTLSGSAVPAGIASAMCDASPFASAVTAVVFA